VEKEGIAAALRRYEATRQDRTAQVQLTSRQNRWGNGVTDVDWVYGYDAWQAPLAAA
jgi:salicylate hydroxylase/6-hydroxynicotinate 3-monooxygenase